MGDDVIRESFTKLSRRKFSSIALSCSGVAVITLGKIDPDSG